MTTIDITPWNAATFADALWVMVAIVPEVGKEYLYDWLDYVILKDDFSEIRRNREDTFCFIALESGLSHTIPYNPTEVTVTIGGVVPTSNADMRDLLMQIVVP